MTQRYKRVQRVLTIFGALVFCFTIFEFLMGYYPLSQSLVFVGECAAGIVLIYLPELVKRLLRIQLPDNTVYFYWFFLTLAVFLGSCLHLIVIIDFWDKILHSVSPMLLTAIGYGLIGLLLGNVELEEISPWLFLIFGFAFAGLCGVFWEFWEFFCDQIGNMNLQRYLDSAGNAYIGRAALLDTMGDFFTNTFGALIMAVFAYFSAKGDPVYYKGYMLKIVPKELPVR